jgi:hypothetical protein
VSIEIDDGQITIANVVSFNLSSDKTTVDATERCDYYYCYEFEKQELAQLIAALQAMHDKMGDL